jgi:hypothetical protein
MQWSPSYGRFSAVHQTPPHEKREFIFWEIVVANGLPAKTTPCTNSVEDPILKIEQPKPTIASSTAFSLEQQRTSEPERTTCSLLCRLRWSPLIRVLLGHSRSVHLVRAPCSLFFSSFFSFLQLTSKKVNVFGQWCGTETGCSEVNRSRTHSLTHTHSHSLSLLRYSSL